MATLIDAAEFTSNEVYQIQATDPVEGAASGASFSGTGDLESTASATG